VTSKPDFKVTKWL